MASVDAAAPLLELTEIEKVYASGEVTHRALRGVDLSIRPGEFVAIVGASGSGKSTLMNIIGCLDRLTTGNYRLDGLDVSDLDNDERAHVRRELIGFVFQGFNLLPRTSALENVELPLIYLGCSAEERRERAVRALELVGLGDRLHNTSAQLSGGQQQRVAIARALVTQPRLLLADEPTGNLDTKTTEEVLALLQWLNRDQGLTIVMVTHEPDVAACASRLVTMRDGLIVSDEQAAEPRRAASHETQEQEASRTGLGRLTPPPDSLAMVVRGWWMAIGLALRALGRAKLRASLTALGILIGIASVVTTSALGAGAQDRMQKSLSTLGANLLMVVPAGSSMGGARNAQGSLGSISEEDGAAILREIPTVAALAPTMSANVQVVAGDRNWSTRAVGTTVPYFEVRSWGVEKGSLWETEDVTLAAPVCLIGRTVEKNLFAGSNPVGRDLRVGKLPCRVTGVLKEKGQGSWGQDNDDIIVMPISTFRRGIYRLPDNQVNNVMVTAKSANLVNRTQAAIESLLNQRHRTPPGEDADFSVRNMAEMMNAMKAQTAIISTLLLVTASISLLVGGIGVMNIMLVSVTERTREIGIRLAIGARRRDILSQFLIEAVVLAAIGGASGIGLGVLISNSLGKMTDFSIAFDPSIMVTSLLVSCGIGIVFGFFPARRAAQFDPIVALRHE
ncbi:MAG: ABC transporter permease [Deltaproteobacteria bacterium]|nr:ABC transporter permease [Deltaproteobacteria bacterium]